jgi:predicted amidophosphoribosyltransferase
MTCPRCRKESPPGAKFCIECAAPLALQCLKCGSPLPAGAKFCPECAHPVETAAEAARFGLPRAYTPRHLADKILTVRSALEGERKQGRSSSPTSRASRRSPSGSTLRTSMA